MEWISKLLKALFFGEDGEVDKTAVHKFKDGILWMLLGMAIFLGLCFYLGEEDEANSYSEEIVEEAPALDDDVL